MKRILLVSSLIVASVLFAMERSVIVLLFVAAMITLYLLFVLAHGKPAHGRIAQRRGAAGQSDAETKEQLWERPSSSKTKVKGKSKGG
jgi:hypothetical protein